MIGIELEARLIEAGFEVVGIAITADEAIALAGSVDPTLVIMDIRLRGDRDGIDAATEIFNALGIRSIFVTAHQEASFVARASVASPLGWLAKPYEMAALISLIRQALLTLER